MTRFVTTVLFVLAQSGVALAACPQDLAVYTGVDGAGELNFKGGGESPSRRVDLLLTGVDPIITYLSVDQTSGRTDMVIPLNCPEGDVTGDELASCVVYHSAVYAVSVAGVIASLPESDQTAAEQILLPNLVSALWGNPQFGDSGPTARPAEVYKLSGCQE